MNKYFRKLPKHQSEVFEQIAIGFDQFHHHKTIEALEKKGLIIRRETKVYGRGNTVLDRMPMTVYRYEVPIPIHMEWCQWCTTVENGEQK